MVKLSLVTGLLFLIQTFVFAQQKVKQIKAVKTNSSFKIDGNLVRKNGKIAR